MIARVLLSAAAALALAAPLAAQDCDCDEDWPDRPRYATGGYAGGSFIYGQPQGEFGRQVDDALGGNAFYLHALDEDGIFGIRVEAGFLNYGYERQRMPLSSSVGDRILVDLVTTNNIAFVGVGPQIGLPNGKLRPYLNGFVGLSYLYTSSSLRGSGSGESFAETTNFDDATFAYGAGAGLYIPLRHGVAPISLDLGATYRNAGQAAYLREGDIEDLPDGGIVLYPRHSDTDVLDFHIGVAIGISRR
jgi:hypothetical protein